MHEQPCDKRIIYPHWYILIKISKIHYYMFHSSLFHIKSFALAWNFST